ncbi:tripartite motif-containing protein 16-like [Alosa pseudoharengus]|uniref:tripartite motif-containing protein 16-like n=1 Tax=Alosa pseudoharengus TaxID=34774 RepID=UPI003F8A3E41
MAEAISQKEDSFTCPVCLDLLKDPVTIPCGHNFCMRCIKGCWDQEDQKGVYSCPLCKHTFTPRPVLYKNPLIAEMVEKCRKTRIEGAVSAQCSAGPGDVECDVCTGRKLKAVKSCLECLVSYCDIHFKVHNDVNPRKHAVIDATGQLQERVCPCHKKVFEIFCRTDQSYLCYLCTMDEHKGHDTVSAAAERSNKQKQLGQTQMRFQQRIQEREKELQELRKAVETLKSSAQTAVEDSERIFTEMIRSIERRRSEVTELIRAQEKAEVSRAEGLLKQLEQEIAELKRRDAELEQLSHTDDHIHFLKNVVSVTAAPCRPVSTSMSFSQSFSFETVKESVSAVKVQLEEKLEGIFKQEVAKISAAVTHIQIIQSLEYTDPELPVRRTDSKEELPPYMSDVQAVFTEPVTRDEFLKYSCHFTLDPNTAHRELHLSEGNRRVERRDELQSYPDHPERFDKWPQVLCREGVSGRCYWEVEWSGHVFIGVSYKSISRKGGGAECGFGCNDQSWSLYSYSSSTSFKHNNKETKLPLVASSRIGVYVDHRAGTLAFYSISDTMTLLHRVQNTFTHTLYPGFWIFTRSSVKLL